MNIKNIRHLTLPSMVKPPIITRIIDDSIIRCTGQPRVVDPPPSKFNASSPPKIRIKCASSGIFTPSACSGKRPSTVINNIFPSLVVATALRGCLVRIKFVPHEFQSQICPSFSISGPEASTIPVSPLYSFLSACSRELTLSSLYVHA